MLIRASDFWLLFWCLGTNIASFFRSFLDFFLAEHFHCMFVNMALVEPSPLSSCTPTPTIDNRRHSSWILQTIPRCVSNDRDINSLGNIPYLDFLSELDGFRTAGDRLNILDITSFRPPSPTAGSALPFPPTPIDGFRGYDQRAEDASLQRQKHPFHTWVKSLRRRATRKSVMERPGQHKQPWAARWPDTNSQERLSSTSRYGKSSSGSSFGFVSAVRSASLSLASASVVARSRRNRTHSHCPSRTDRSSRDSMQCPRISEDSTTLDGTLALNLASFERSLQRRQILEELINTEENYVGDIRFLTNVHYFLKYVLLITDLFRST